MLRGRNAKVGQVVIVPGSAGSESAQDRNDSWPRAPCKMSRVTVLVLQVVLLREPFHLLLALLLH